MYPHDLSTQGTRKKTDRLLEEQRPLLREERPGLSAAEATKELARRWNLCEDRDKYKKEAAENKARYEEEQVS